MIVQTWFWTAFCRTFRIRIIGQRFVQDVSVLTVANLAGAALSFAQSLLVARWLGPEFYGVAGLVMSYPDLVYTLFSARSFDASVKYLSEFHARGERDHTLAMCNLGYIVDFALASLAFLVVLATAPWATRIIVNRPETLGSIIVYAASFVPRALVGTSQAIMVTLGRFRLIAWLNALTTFLRVTLVLALVLADWQVAGVVWGNAMAAMATGVLYGIIAWMLIRRTWGAFPSRGNWQALKGRRRGILGFLAYNDLNTLVGIIPKQLDIIFLGYFRHPMEVGYYKLAKSLASELGRLVGPLQSVIYPQLIRLSGLEDQHALRQTAQCLALGVGAPLGFLVVVGTFLIPLLLPAILGPAYLPVVPAAQLLLTGSAIWLAFFWIRPLYMALGNMRQWLIITTSVAGLSLVAYPFVVSYWGYLGLSSWSLAMQLFSHGMAVWWFLRTQRTSSRSKMR